MKLLGWALGLLLVIGGIDDIATINRLKKQAEEAYQQGDYTQAVQYYQLLVDSMQVQDERVRLNLAHAQLHAGDTATAQRQYGQLMNAEGAAIKSVAYQQLGNITTQQQQYDNALAMYKESLKANPTNEDARYNYELVKKLKKEQEQQQQQSDDNQEQSDEEKDQQEQQNQEQNEEQSEQQQDQEGESTDEQNQEQQQSESDQQEGDQQQSNESEPQEQNTQQGEEQSEGEKSEEEMSNSPLSERLEEMNISEEKARMILEAMRNNEMQYIQQNRRKPTKPKDRSKPDW
ncbi:hypothetical protein [Tunicatimonas pelagia]|uniref:hypothetical protein n=1 Tax=Tunicatimonas pelagia TaxID=931531 RepID=UPI00266522DC|nr:hypothetical protein [Tunicatimonas pelagia]WKN45366.1 hypothetical protein P0M28_10390 [Tunicatimonas pelagia]